MCPLCKCCASCSAEGKVWCIMVERINVPIVICRSFLHNQLPLSTSLLLGLFLNYQCWGLAQQHRARRPIGRGVAVAMPEVALFFEGLSHGNMEHYATLANTPDSLPSCLCPARQLHHLSSSTWDTWRWWPQGYRSLLIILKPQFWITTKAGKMWVRKPVIHCLCVPKQQTAERGRAVVELNSSKWWMCWDLNNKKQRAGKDHRKEVFQSLIRFLNLLLLKRHMKETALSTQSQLVYG